MIPQKATTFDVLYQFGKKTETDKIDADDLSEVHETALLKANRIEKETGLNCTIDIL